MWKRVNKKNPCLICNHYDWCTYTADGTTCCCMRTPNDRPMKNGGYCYKAVTNFILDKKKALGKINLHGVKASREAYEANTHHQGKPSPTIDWEAKAKKYAADLKTADLMRLAANLGLSHTSLKRLQTGYDGQAFTFPMQNADGAIVGIRRRLTDGKKLSVTGGHEGCFVPDGAIGDMTSLVLVAEGPTDTAALLDAGFSAIGRPNCTGGVEIVKALTSKRDVVIVSDNDDPGARGAITLAKSLARPGHIIKVVYPLRGKDVRAWHPSHAVLSCVIRNTENWRPNANANP